MSYVIPSSKVSVTHQIILSGVLVLLACMVLSLFFERIGDIAPITYQVLVVATWVGLPALWAILSLHEHLTSDKTTYTLLDDCLQVHKKGWFGMRHEDLYRYDSILSVSSSSRGHGAYGTVALRLHRQTDIVLTHVARPAEQATKIKQMVKANRRTTNFV